MKKLLSTILCLGLMSVNSICFAAEASKVSLRLTSIPLKTSLQNKYSAYRIEYFNEGQNPVRVNEIRCYNQVTTVNTFADYKIKKSTIAGLLFAIPTLGISALCATPSLNEESNKLVDVENEAKRFGAVNSYTPNNDTRLVTNNEILEQGQCVFFNVLVPLNDSPDLSASFENQVNHQYIRIQGTK